MPGIKIIQIRVPAELAEKLKNQAESAGISVNTAIVQSIKKSLTDDGKAAPEMSSILQANINTLKNILFTHPDLDGNEGWATIINALSEMLQTNKKLLAKSEGKS